MSTISATTADNPVRDHTKRAITARLKATLTMVWELNNQEKSYLDRHFMLIRTTDDFIAHHIDDHLMYNKVIVNAGIHYSVQLQGITENELTENSTWIQASFRYQKRSNFAVVIIRPYYTKEKEL